MIAQLMHAGHSRAEICSMTMAQITGLGFYPRKKTGELKPPRIEEASKPAPPRTLEGSLFALETFRAFVPEAEILKARRELLEKYGKTEEDAERILRGRHPPGTDAADAATGGE